MKLGGWMRLWVVVSVFWGIGAALFASTMLYQLYQREVVLLAITEEGDPTKHLEPLTLVYSRLDYYGFSSAETQWRSLVDADKARFAGANLDTPYVEYLEKEEANNWLAVLGVVFGPPVLLLLIGTSVAWVRRGFLPQPQTEATDSNPYMSDAS